MGAEEEKRKRPRIKNQTSAEDATNELLRRAEEAQKSVVLKGDVELAKKKEWKGPEIGRAHV